eukprot:946469-Rhodomonas_salina.2
MCPSLPPSLHPSIHPSLPPSLPLSLLPPAGTVSTPRCVVSGHLSPISLRALYDMSGPHIAYAAMSLRARSVLA